MKIQKNPLEWSVFFVSLLLIGACITLLVMQMMSSGAVAHADLVITTDAPTKVTEGFLVPVTVSNEGEETAADVEGEIELTKSGATVETGTFTLAYAPAQSKRKAAVVFTVDPRCCEIETRVRGYIKP